MGLGIRHSGGPLNLAAVEEILRYLEDRFNRAGLKEVVDWKRSRDNVYWNVNGPISKIEAEVFEKTKGLEKYTELDLRELRAELAEGDPRRKLELEARIQAILKKQARTKLVVPMDFRPTMQRGIIGNLDPKAESLGIVFTQNGSNDEWRDLGGYTKTSFIDPWPGAHIMICEILQDVQQMAKSAGGDFEIQDECEICDDYVLDGKVRAT